MKMTDGYIKVKLIEPSINEKKNPIKIISGAFHNISALHPQLGQRMNI